MIEHVEILVEERSTAEALRLILPKLLGAATFVLHEHRGKNDLVTALTGRLRGYASWLPEKWRIIVIVDRDDDDCYELKGRLEKMARDVGLVTRSVARRGRYTVVNRLAIEELEAWYFGDWQAVRMAYPRVSARIPFQEPYRDPDAIKGGTCESFERVMQSAGYFKSGLLKLEAAREIGRHMDPARNRSHSFGVFRATLLEIASE